jgi:tetratricopeptide (TPR) repeat protein
VDQSRFQEAQQAYDAGEFRAAAKGFLASAGRGADGNGAAYHMAGNALMRLRRYADAVTVYGHALRDQIYDRRGAVLANLGVAYCELGEYTEAARSYEQALVEPDYTTPWKAYQGMAGALLERGRIEDAAVAYRKAALDAENPDPGRALVNLGLCFMGLGRPADAVEAYRAALGFDQYKGRGLALANLGLAYVALGRYEDAVKSFEKASGLHGHKLSPAAAAAQATALAHVRPEQPAATPAPATAAPAPAPARELVEGWVTGEQPPVTETPAFAEQPPVPQTPAFAERPPVPETSAFAERAVVPPPAATGAPAAEPAADTTGFPFPDNPSAETIPGTTMNWDVLAPPTESLPEASELAASIPAPEPVPSHEGPTAELSAIGDQPVAGATPAADSGAPAAVGGLPTTAPAGDDTATAGHHHPLEPLIPFDHLPPGGAIDFGDEEAVEEFFSATEEELKERDREARRAARHEKGPWAIWRNVIVAAVVVLVVIGALFGAYQLGYGWPTQTQTVGGMLSAFEQGDPVDGYWVAAPTKDISKEMAKIPPVKSFSVDNVQMGATTSKAEATVTPRTGAALHYTITLSREGVGWKVSGVDNDWSTTGG